MKIIQITFNLTDELGIKSIVIDQNDTGLPNNTDTIENLAFALYKVIKVNRQDLQIQDILHESKLKLT